MRLPVDVSALSLGQLREYEKAAKQHALHLARKRRQNLYVVYDPTTRGRFGPYHVATDYDCDTVFHGAEVVWCTEEAL